MEQFREIGEVLGSIRALMVFQDNIQINQRQCTLLLDLFTAAYDSISESMRSNLRFNEKNTKWKILEQPFRELLWVVREGEAYVRMSLEPKLGFWAKAIVLHCNRDCTELHIHNLLSCLPIIVEAIETAGEVSGWDEEEMSKKKLVHAHKYMKQWNDSQMFTWKFGREYLVTEDFCNRFESAWLEDRWMLIKKLQEKTQPGSSKHDRKMTDFLLKNLGDGNESPKLFPSSLLVSTKDYQVKKRLGNGSQYKEITWLGESFALRHFFGDIDALLPQVTPLLSLSHPNIVYYLCGFTDEEKKECFLVTELMSKTLGMHIKEVCGPRKKNTLSLSVAVDLMLQIALGMEYLHSKKIYHGELNPSNILVKPRRSDHSGDGYLHGKIFGFGLNSVKGFSSKSASLTGQNENVPFIWYSPEVLEELEQSGSAESLKYTDKADVYSFGMVCFELLTGKVPFEDSHLQGDKTSRNIRAGERPLFPFHSPKFITNLTKRCWHADPNQRPTFSSICRILRYIKRFLALNPECHSSSQQDPPIAPPVDYCEIETKLLQKLSWESTELTQVSQVPFQMFAYRVVEQAKTCKKKNHETSESGSEWASCSEDEGGTGSDEQVSSEKETKLSCSNDVVGMSKKHVSKLVKRASGLKPIIKPGTPRGRSRHPPLSPCGQSMRTNSESQLILISPKIRRSHSGHVSDSELS